jgi:D-alanyl-D-alanine endopeptidase (penicillin-binding protein 7)
MANSTGTFGRAVAPGAGLWAGKTMRLCYSKLAAIVAAVALLFTTVVASAEGRLSQDFAKSSAVGSVLTKSRLKPSRSVFARTARSTQSRARRNGATGGELEDVPPLKSAVALVVDQDTDEVLFQKNAQAVLPIASITKLLTALVTIEADLPLDETLEVTRDDRTVDRVRSRLRPGVRLTRGQALQLALMSSENHAAQLLGRTYPGGVAAFVDAMNARAQLLGMHDSHFADPTGLSAENRSSPTDLVKLVKAGYEHELIRQFSTASGMVLPVGKRVIRYGSTNRLISNPDWEIGLQKTGYISAAGRCLVMQSVIAGRRVVMVLLDSAGKYSRLGDAQRIRAWIANRKVDRPEDRESVKAAASDL